MKKIIFLMVGLACCCTVFAQKTYKDLVKHFMNREAPKFEVAEWVTEEPDTRGKFVVWEFWGIKCNPCMASIPHLNAMSKKYKKEAVFIGLGYDTAEKVKAMKKPEIKYYIAVDLEKRTMKAINLIFVPYLIAVDPQGYVCWEGNPMDFTEEVMNDLIRRRGYTLDWELRQADVTQYRVKLNSFLGKPSPELVVKEWVTEKPDMEGKNVLYEMYGTHCPPCWKAVPKLNALQEQFQEDLVIVGINNAKGKHAKEPESYYYKGIDPERTVYNAIGLRSVPYALLVDPKGIVRWEGSPLDLDEVVMEKLIKKYGK